MIKALHSTDEIVLVLANMITTQSELPYDYVLNGETHQGAKLGHVVNTYDEKETLISSELIPFTTSELFIVFDLTEDSEKTKTQVLSDDKLESYAYFTFDCCIYGDNADLLAQKLLSRIVTEKVRTDLEKNGVHLESCEPVNSMNEYINNIYWQRKQIELKISCRFEFTQVEVDKDMIHMKEIETKLNES